MAAGFCRRMSERSFFCLRLLCWESSVTRRSPLASTTFLMPSLRSMKKGLLSVMNETAKRRPPEPLPEEVAGLSAGPQAARVVRRSRERRRCMGEEVGWDANLAKRTEFLGSMFEARCGIGTRGMRILKTN
jgi:hypothetical protein